MGMFDNFIKIADKGLKAIEDGAIEKRLVSAIDKLDAGLEKSIKTAEKAAATPEKLLKTAEDQKGQLEQKAQLVQEQMGKTMDIIQRKE
jgi:predicted transcriptional regulator of viral defense system